MDERKASRPHRNDFLAGQSGTPNPGGRADLATWNRGHCVGAVLSVAVVVIDGHRVNENALEKATCQSIGIFPKS